MRKPLPDLLLKLWPIQSQQITNRSEFFSNKTANSSGPFNNYTTMATNVPQKTWKKLRIQRPTPYLHGQLKCMQHTIRGIFMSKADESHSHDRRDITSQQTSGSTLNYHDRALDLIDTIVAYASQKHPVFITQPIVFSRSNEKDMGMFLF